MPVLLMKLIAILSYKGLIFRMLFSLEVYIEIVHEKNPVICFFTVNHLNTLIRETRCLHYSDYGVAADPSGIARP